jgi:hypothetical protein
MKSFADLVYDWLVAESTADESFQFRDWGSYELAEDASIEAKRKVIDALRAMDYDI